jgi:putative Mg2+ transporter-C (MgtC) family protein
VSADRIGVLTILTRLGAAFLFALPLAWEREKGRHLGLRTVPLVSVGACGYLLLNQLLGEGPEATARVLQGVLTGIGFIGGGAILKQGADVIGIATAAAIWNTGAIGAAIAYGEYLLGLFLALINVLILVLGEIARRFGSKLRQKDARREQRT